MTTSDDWPKGSTAGADRVVAALEDVSYDAGDVRVLEHVSLRIAAGDFLGIIGPNGCGKTTLLRVLLGLLPPSAGRALLFGTDVRQFRQWARVGYVPQRSVVEPRFPASVFEVVMSGCSPRTGLLRRYGPAERAAVLQALETVGMAAARDRRIGALSPGQQQRVFIARALVHRPELLILDEPTVGVDVEAQEQFYALLRRLNREGGVTLVLVSHDISVVAQEVTRLACLNRTLVFHGDPDEAIRSGALERLYRSASLVVTHRH
jgi:zinc transport system ATP-binding protein